jgi:hypothetical protein
MFSLRRDSKGWFLPELGAVVFPAQTWESVSQTWVQTRGKGEARAQTGEKKAQKIFDRVQKTGPATNRWASKKQPTHPTTLVRPKSEPAQLTATQPPITAIIAD